MDLNIGPLASVSLKISEAIVECKEFIWDQSNCNSGSRDSGRSPDRVPSCRRRIQGLYGQRQEDEVRLITGEFTAAMNR